MKKVISILTLTAVIAIVMASCKGKTSTANSMTGQDTTGFAAFKEWQAWKAQEDLALAQQQAVPKQKVVYVKQQSSSGSMNSSTTNEAKQKKGWSKAAKGAVIGTAGGAVLGAVINKRNRVAGGVIGGILGGGIGYGIGRSKDKKDGRY